MNALKNWTGFTALTAAIAALVDRLRSGDGRRISPANPASQVEAGVEAPH